MASKLKPLSASIVEEVFIPSPLVRIATEDGEIMVDLYAVSAVEHNNTDDTIGVLLRSGEGFRIAGLSKERQKAVFEALLLRLGALSDANVEVL